MLKLCKACKNNISMNIIIKKLYLYILNTKIVKILFFGAALIDGKFQYDY